MLMPNPDLLLLLGHATTQHLLEEASHERLANQARRSRPRSPSPASALTPHLSRAMAALRAAWPTPRARRHHRLVDL